jgi:uncharacterized protein YbbC (DUF1343 family)
VRTGGESDNLWSGRLPNNDVSRVAATPSLRKSIIVPAPHSIRFALRVVTTLAILAGAACSPARGSSSADDASAAQPGRVRPGISVLLTDSVHLIRGKRIGLLTNQTGLDEQGRSDIDLLRSDSRATAANVTLVRLFSPEHGIRGTEDRSNIASTVDERTGLPIHSLYGAMTIAPPDTTLRDLDALVFDLADIGTRTWTYVGNLVYSLRAAKRTGIELIVLDRPNPLNGARRDGPMLDASLANPDEPTPARAGQAYALYPFPLRHGMTMGEMALYYNATLNIGAHLRVIPMAGWRRAMWYDDTGLPWVRPSPNMPTLTSALIYPALVPFEGSNLSVGRGTSEAFQQVGAPWLNAAEVARTLNARGIAGVHFDAIEFTPTEPGDRKFAGQRIPGVRIVIDDRNRVHAGRLGASILWAVTRVNRDSLRVTARTFDLRFGNPAAREALMAGEDPDTVIDREIPGVVAFERAARPYFLYR